MAAWPRRQRKFRNDLPKKTHFLIPAGASCHLHLDVSHMQMYARQVMCSAGISCDFTQPQLRYYGGYVHVGIFAGNGATLPYANA